MSKLQNNIGKHNGKTKKDKSYGAALGGKPLGRRRKGKVGTGVVDPALARLRQLSLQNGVGPTKKRALSLSGPPNRGVRQALNVGGGGRQNQIVRATLPGSADHRGWDYLHPRHWGEMLERASHAHKAYKQLSATVHEHTGKTIGDHARKAARSLGGGAAYDAWFGKDPGPEVLEAEQVRHKNPLKIATQHSHPANHGPNSELATSARIAMSSAPAAYSTSMPGMGYSMRPGGKDSILVEGTDYLHVVTSAEAQYAAGNAILNLDINPKMLNLPRLHALSALYEFYDLETEIMYEPACGSETAGQCVGYYDMDPEDALDIGLDARLHQAFGHAGVRTSNWWKPQHWIMPRKKGSFYVDMGDEERMVIKSRFVLLSSIASASTSSVGIFYIRYRCRLSRSKIDSQTASGAPYLSAVTSTIGTPTDANPLGQTAVTIYSISAGSTLSMNTTVGAATENYQWQVTGNAIYPPVGWNQPFLVDIRWSGTTATTATWSPTSGLTVFPSTENFTLDGGSTTGNFRSQRAYYPTRPQKDPRADYISLSLATYTSPTFVNIGIVPLAYQATLNRFRRLDFRVNELKAKLTEIAQTVRALETDEQKKFVDDGKGIDPVRVAERKRLQEMKLEVAESDTEEDEGSDQVERKRRHSRVPGRTRKAESDETHYRKEGLGLVVGASNGNQLNVLQDEKGPVRPIDQVTSAKGGRLQRLSDNEFVHIQSTEELLDLKERVAQRTESAGLSRGIDSADRTPDTDRRSTTRQSSAKGTKA